MGEKNNSSVFFFKIDNLEVKSSDEYVVEGNISHPNIDLVDDVMTLKCQRDITEQIKSGNIKLDYEHEAFRQRDGESEKDAELNKTINPLGKIVDGVLDEEGATRVEAILNKNWVKTDPRGNVVKTFSEVWEEITNGFLDAFSVAFIPEKSYMETIEGKTIRKLDKVRLLNVAMTGNPVQPRAQVTAYGVQEAMVKSLDSLGGNKMPEEQTKTYEDLESSIKELKNEMSSLKEELNSKSEEETKEEKSQATEEVTEIKGMIKELSEELKSVKEDFKAKMEQPVEKSQHTNIEEQNSQEAEQKSQNSKEVSPLDIF